MLFKIAANNPAARPAVNVLLKSDGLVESNSLNCIGKSDLTSKLKKMFARNVNVYLSAEEAVEYGIADEVI